MLPREPALRLLAGCGLAALLGCAPAPSPSPAPAAPVGDVEVLQYRRDAALGVLQVRVVPRRDARLSSVALRSPRFPDAAPVPRDSRLVRGRAVALPVPHGEPDCAAPAGGGLEVDLTVDGERLRLPADPAVLDRAADRLCAARELARQVRVTVAGVRPAPGGASAVLEVRRRDSAEPLEVTGFGGHVLLAVEPTGPLPSLAPGTAAARTGLRLRAARCDPHALAESKQTATLRVLVRVGTREPEQVLVRLGPGDARALEALVVAACR